MLLMIANPVTALPIGYPRSGLSRSDLVRWPMTTDIALRRYFRTWGLSRHCADCREMCGCNLVTPRLSAGPQQLRQLGDVGGHAPRFIAGEEMRRRAMLQLPLEIDVSERLPISIADDEAPPIQVGVSLVSRPGRREAAGGHRGLAILPMLAGASRDQRTSMARSRWRGR
jgi:hypothetical protein